MWITNVYVWICVYACMETMGGIELVDTGNKCEVSLRSNNEYGCRLNGTDGSHQYRISFNVEKFEVECDRKRVFDYINDLPHMKEILNVKYITLKNCSPPAKVSFAEALAAFNVQLRRTDPPTSLELHTLLETPQLSEKHFDGLDYLTELSVINTGAQPTPGFLSPLRNLRSLKIMNMQLPPGALNDMPNSLSELILSDTGLRRLPDHMPNLTSLTLKQKQLEPLQKLCLPQTLTKLNMRVTSHNITLQDVMVSALEDLTLNDWPETRVSGPLTSCDNLKSLYLESPAVRTLPDGWLKNCKKLTNLYVKYAINLSNANTTFLRGATKLVNVTLINGALHNITERLFRGLTKLTNIDLHNNNLHTLRSNTFSELASLKTLILSSNDLNETIWDVLRPLENLRTLDLSKNLHLGGVCRTSTGISKLYHMRFHLEKLVLSETRTTHICQDWRRDMPLLRDLYLQETDIVWLQAADMRIRSRDNGLKLKVRLKGANITSVEFNESDYDKSGNTLTDGAEFILGNNAPLKCDCRMYWTKLALNKTPKGKSGVFGLRCAGGRSLRETHADELLCPAEKACQAAGLPRGCTCAVRTARGARLLLRVDCAGAALRHVPRLRAASDWLWDMDDTFPIRSDQFKHDRVDYEMVLRNNNISSLSAADLTPRAANLTPRVGLPLQHRFLEFDLTNNNLTRVGDDAATLIQNQPSMRVLLAHNPLDCDCGVVGPLLRALSREDMQAATCDERTGGRKLNEVECGKGMSPFTRAGFALLGLLLFCVTGAALLGNRERQLTVIVLLHKIGLMRRRAERDDEGRLFDAFVSFSHEDENIVRELVDRLESGPTPYRLCLHYRDWVPGRFIPDQIVESVRRSRRTVALVSRHFLDSTWACAEFREAYAHAMTDLTPRLVVVLLEEAAALPLDPRLRRYLRSNTYVRWGDTWFWDKIKLALPTPRPPPAPPELAPPSELAPLPKLAPPLVTEEAL